MQQSSIAISVCHSFSFRSKSDFSLLSVLFLLDLPLLKLAFDICSMPSGFSVGQNQIFKWKGGWLKAIQWDICLLCWVFIGYVFNQSFYDNFHKYQIIIVRLVTVTVELNGFDLFYYEVLSWLEQSLTSQNTIDYGGGRTSEHQKLVPPFPWIDNCQMVTNFHNNRSVTMTNGRSQNGSVAKG